MRRPALQPALLLPALLLITACTGAAAPTPAAAEQVSLRAWTTQPLPPRDVFGIGPLLAIEDGLVISPGAVPAIYPGPLVAPLTAQPISDAGVAAVVRELQAAGLLGDRTDFTDDLLAGGVVGHLLLTINGVPREITGDPGRTIQCVTTPCVPPPGTPEAFATMWNRLYDLGGWLGSELGASERYAADRVAILVTEPTVDPGFPGNVVEWPLAVPLGEIGAPFAGLAGARCGVIGGADLEPFGAAMAAATQLTRFRDATGLERGLVVRPLVPGEPDPCAPAG